MFPNEIFKRILLYTNIDTIVTFNKISKICDKHFFMEKFKLDGIDFIGDNYDHWVNNYNIQKYKLSYLPEEYKGIIREKHPGFGRYNSRKPFWDSTEVKDITFKEIKFCTDGGHLSPLEVNNKGFICINCGPGSDPKPFIVVHIDNEKGILGVIHPYVYIVDVNNEYVDLMVGADMLDKKEEYKQDKQQFLKKSIKYKVCFYDLHFMLCHRHLSFCSGSLGNHDLPYADGTGEYEFLDNC